MTEAVLVSCLVGLVVFFITAVAFLLIALGTQYPLAIAGAFIFGLAGFALSMIIELMTQHE